MATKNKKTVLNTLNKTLKNLNTTSVKFNDYALNSTENIFSELINTTEKWQVITNNALKGSLKFTAIQQDMIFDTLESTKGQMLKSFKKSKALFSKN